MSAFGIERPNPVHCQSWILTARERFAAFARELPRLSHIANRPEADPVLPRGAALTALVLEDPCALGLVSTLSNM